VCGALFPLTLQQIGRAVLTISDVRIEVSQRQDGIQLARTAGELDALGAPILRECLNERIDSAHDFVLDLDEVTFLGSAALEVLLDTDDNATRRHIRWALVGNHRPVARPLRVTGLAARLPVEPSVPAAILRLTAPSVVGIR
jgi:anti-sigma B factor antagonist